MTVAQRRSTIAIACLGMASFGIVLTTLGATLPSVISRFGIDKTQAGALLSLLTFGVLAGSLVFGPIVDARGYRGLLLVAFTAIVVGLEIIAFAPSLSWLRVALLLTGLAGGLVNGCVNALAADVGGQQRGATLALVGAFFGVGAAGVPLVLATLSGRFSLTAMLAVIPAFVIVPLVLTAITTFPLPKQPHAFPVADTRRMLRDPVLVLIGLMLFLESGMESIVGGWTSTFFVDELGVAIARAPLYLALFWLGMLLTRLTLGVGLKKSGTPVLALGMAVAFAGTALLLATRSVTPAAVAVFLLGCGFAPAFPILLARAADRYAHIAGTALSVVFTMALAGGMLAPYVGGVIADARGLRASLVLVPVSLAAMAVLLAQSNALIRRKSVPHV